MNIFGGPYKIGLDLEVISMHFSNLMSRYRMVGILGMLKFLWCLIFLIFLGDEW